MRQRQTVENLQRAAFVRAQTRLEGARAELSRLELDYTRAVHAIDRTGSALPAALENAIATARLPVSQCLMEVEEARATLLDAVRDRKALELMKKRRLAEYEAYEGRKEERELDEANQA